MSITNCQSSQQSIERNTNLKQNNTDPLKSKGMIKFLGGVSISADRSHRFHIGKVVIEVNGKIWKMP